jgi:hypothetical protein
LGSTGTPTNSFSSDGNVGSWSAILSNPSFHLGTNETDSIPIVANVNAMGLSVGGIVYEGGASFYVPGTAGGQTYTIYCFAWNNAYADPYLAAAAGSPVGWSKPFQYVTALDQAHVPPTFTQAGMQPFGVVVPEPTAIALAILGLASLILHRQPKGSAHVPRQPARRVFPFSQ